MDTPEYQRHSKCRLKTIVFVGDSQQDMHGEYADKQLANLQKRIFLIEFLHLGLVIVYQGTYPLPPRNADQVWSVFILKNGAGANLLDFLCKIWYNTYT